MHKSTKTRRAKGGGIITMVVADLSSEEQRAHEWFTDMLNVGGDVPSSAFAALTTLAHPDPLFVTWLSEGHLANVSGKVLPASPEAVTSLRANHLMEVVTQ